MTDNLHKSVKTFLEGNFSEEGEKIWNSWFQNSNSNDQNDLIITSSTDLQKEIKFIKRRKNNYLFSINTIQLQIAATLLVFLSMGTWWISTNQSNTFLSSFFCKKTETRFGQKEIVTLSDGSIIHLNSGSVLKYPKNFSGATREVYLEGEAFFEVAKDKKHPFIIHTSKMDTKVIGTSFNIRAYPNHRIQEVSVLTGKVSVSSIDNNKKIALLPGQKITVSNQDNTLKTHNDINKITIGAWRNNILVFENTPINELIENIEINYGIEVEFNNNSSKNIQISARFVELDPDQIINILSKTINGSFTKDENRYVIKL